jgi:hypothetical protein
MVSLQMMINQHKTINSDAFFNKLFDVAKQNINKDNKTFMKTWLAARKAHPSTHPQPEALMLDSEEDESVNNVASVKLNAAEGTETKLSNANDDKILSKLIIIIFL